MSGLKKCQLRIENVYLEKNMYLKRCRKSSENMDKQPSCRSDLIPLDSISQFNRISIDCLIELTDLEYTFSSDERFFYFWKV